MSWILRFWKSSIGGKLTMAATGLMLFGFVVGHLTGNLLVFRGAEAMNDYAAFLQSKPGFLWTARIGLLAVVAVHIATAISLTRANKAARPVAYAKQESQVSSMASRSMMLTGATLGAYVVFHLAHLTWGLILGDHYALTDADGRHDVYSMLVLGFRQPLISLLYLAAMALLGLHLRHGVTSFFQTIGFNHSRYNGMLDRLGIAVAALIFGGYAAIPLSIMAGWIGEGVA